LRNARACHNSRLPICDVTLVLLLASMSVSR
jgi:hypothetical protein